MTTSFKRRSRIRWANQLMKEGSKEWDTEPVNQIFHPFDVEEICKIRTPTSTTEGCIVWHYEKSGNFTLKSANNLADEVWSQSGESPREQMKSGINHWTTPMRGKVKLNVDVSLLPDN